MAKVSVIIPVYNIEPYLEECLDSVLNQTLSDLEVICVDDGSTDRSPDILRRLAQQDPRVNVVRQNNAGPGAARNTGLDKASGEFLIFLDSDDRFAPGMLEAMVDRAEKTGAEVVICHSQSFDSLTGDLIPSDWMLKDGLLTQDVFNPNDVTDRLFQITYGWPWDKLYRTDFVRKHHFRYPEFRNSEDLVFVFHSLTAASLIAIAPNRFVFHRMNRNDSVSNSRHKDPADTYQAVERLRHDLVISGQYQCFEQTFLKWAMEFFVWNVANMSDKTTQKAYWLELRTKWFPKYAFQCHPYGYYGDLTCYTKYLLAKYAPFGVFCEIVKLYKRAKKS